MDEEKEILLDDEDKAILAIMVFLQNEYDLEEGILMYYLQLKGYVILG